jgi:hypothetical protein
MENKYITLILEVGSKSPTMQDPEAFYNARSKKGVALWAKLIDVRTGNIVKSYTARYAELKK